MTSHACGCKFHLHSAIKQGASRGICVTSSFETSLTGAESGHKNVFKNYNCTSTGLFFMAAFSHLITLLVSGAHLKAEHSPSQPCVMPERPKRIECFQHNKSLSLACWMLMAGCLAICDIYEEWTSTQFLFTACTVLSKRGHTFSNILFVWKLFVITGLLYPGPQARRIKHARRRFCADIALLAALSQPPAPITQFKPYK